jgi:carboxypeptidase T
MNKRVVLTLIVAWALTCRSTGLVAAQSAATAEPTVASPGERTIVRVYYPDAAAAAQVLISFEPQLLATNYTQGYHILQVTPDDIARLLAAGLRVEPEETWVTPPVWPLPQVSAQTISGYPCYRTVEETFAAAQALAVAHPELATWADVGNSWEKSTGLGGYDLMVLKLTNLAISGDKPRLFVTAAIHAREYATAELVTRFGEYLVDNYGTDADATWILDYHEVHLLLQVNPDGRKKAETGLLWRKNTNQNYCGAASNNRGADLNRNFDFQWACCGGSSSSPCNEVYHGPYAASEPEVQAVQAYMASLFPDQRGASLTDPAPADATGVYIDVHSYGQLVLWPWGFASSAAPNGTALQTLGRKWAYFNGYTPEQAIGLYPTDGVSDDYAYGVLGVAAYTWEVGTAFFESCSYFESTLLPANLPALVYAAKVARSPYLTPAGPDAISVTLSTDNVAAGTLVTVAASIDDTRYSSGNGREPTQNIASAEYYVDLPPWVPGATPHAMAASDGSFNNPTESAIAGIDTARWSSGKHILFVRGQDADGNWGALTGVFLSIREPTAVEVTSFAATGEPGAIRLNWETVRASRCIGFNLYRAIKANGLQIQVNDDLIRTLVPPGSPLDATYSYQDRTVKRGTRYFYWLEDVDIYGHATLYGPVQACAS